MKLTFWVSSRFLLMHFMAYKLSIGIVTALNPIIGYKSSTKVAKEAHATGRSVYDIVIEQGLMTKEELDEALDPKHMLQSHKFSLK